MKNAEPSAIESTRTLLRLPEHVTVSSIAAACRDAWRVFIEQSEEWSKAEQVLWSCGLYAPIAQHGTYAKEQRGAEANDDYRFVDARFIERMIKNARVVAYDVLTSFALPRARLAFGRRMRDEGAVTRCVDRFGRVGYVPTPVTDSLADRILALIAADLLSRPGDFEGETLCSECGGVVAGPRPCCARYEGRDTCIPSKRQDTVPSPHRIAS
jgi:hypothetical protein